MLSFTGTIIKNIHYPATLDKWYYLMSLTTSMAASTGPTRRWPSRPCSLQTTSPSHSVAPSCSNAQMLLVLMVSPDLSSGPVLCSWLRSWLTYSTCHYPKQLSPCASNPPLLYKCQNTPLQWALMTSIQLHSPHHKVLWEAGPGSPQNQFTTHTGPLTIHLLPDQEYRRCYHQGASLHSTLKKVHLSPQILVHFNCCTIESIFTNCVTVWYGNCSVSDLKAQQRVVKTAEHVMCLLKRASKVCERRVASSRTVLTPGTDCSPSPLGGATGLSAPGPVGSGEAFSLRL